MVHVMSELRSTDIQGLDNLTEMRKNIFTRFYFTEALVLNLCVIMHCLSREVNPCRFWHPHVIDAVTAERSKEMPLSRLFRPIDCNKLDRNLV